MTADERRMSNTITKEKPVIPNVDRKLEQQVQPSQPTAPDVAIEIDGLSSWYGDFQALHSISLNIEKNP